VSFPAASAQVDPADPRPWRQPPFVGLAGIRRLVGLKQHEVCAKVEAILGKSFTTGALSAIEKGHRGASPEVLGAIQTALGIHPGDLETAWEPSHSRRKSVA
jgi:hypothetical protein